MITVRAPTGDKSAAAITVRTPTGDKAVATATLRTPTGDEVIYSAGGGAGMLSLTTSPVSVSGSGGSAGDLTLVTSTVTVSVSGGTAPYTHEWTFVSGDTGWIILSPAAAATRFQNDVPTVDSKFGTFRDTVTDARGRTGAIDVDASLYNFGALGGF